MTIWLWIAVVSSAIYWSIFFYFVSRQHWTKAALAVGVLHMLFATPLTVAPIRSFIDANYTAYSLGFLRFEGRNATLPAALFLAWALGSAWAVVLGKRGWWLKAVAIGDLFFALSLGVPLVKEFINRDPTKVLIQFGEHLSLYHRAWALVPLLLFALPFVFSALWAFRTTNANGAAPPQANNARKERDTTLPARNSGQHLRVVQAM